jgi:hypothetical protein
MPELGVLYDSMLVALPKVELRRRVTPSLSGAGDFLKQPMGESYIMYALVSPHAATQPIHFPP